MNTFPKKEHLYDLFKPTHYDVYLDINRETKTFNGKVAMEGEAVKPNIKFNEKFLNITAVKVNNEAVDFNVDDQAETVDGIGQAIII